MKRPFSLLIKPVSYLCNLRCKYCFYCYDNKAELGKAEVMSDATLDALITNYAAAAHPPYIFAFQGGEPLLAGIDFYERFIEMLNHRLPPRTSVSVAIQTNGTLINEEWAALFKKMNALIGVSIDGDADIHDANRVDGSGKGSFERAYNGFRLLVENGVPANVLTTVNALTAKYPERIYDFLRSEAKVDFMQFIPIFDLDEKGDVLPHSVRADDYHRFLSVIFERWKISDPRPSVRLFDNMYEAILGQRPSSCQFAPNCGGYFLVEANGNVYPCDFYAEKRWLLGNVARDEFSSIFESSKSRKFSELKQHYMKKNCEACEVRHYCYGGCPHYSRTGYYEFCSVNKRFLPVFKEFADGLAPNVGAGVNA